MSYKTRKLFEAWIVGVGIGAGIVIAWQVGDWQYRLVKAWKRWI